MKYVAELAHVREVSLLGSADLGFWAERLRGEGLTPVEHAGRARVLVVACDSKFFGVRFRELSFSVFVRRPNASGGVSDCLENQATSVAACQVCCFRIMALRMVSNFLRQAMRATFFFLPSARRL